jgi:hypothetical protein
MKTGRFHDWFPIRIDWQESGPTVDWAYLGTLGFTEPFFDYTVELALRSPFGLLFRHRTPVETLLEWHEASPGLEPTGFIFHMSRCGSTLLSQLLATRSQSIVISEAVPIDSILRATQLPEATRLRWLRAMLSALGQRRGGTEAELFIKFDCCHTTFLPLLRRAYPLVPWVFVYREPTEVMVSQCRRRTTQFIPGVVDPRNFGMDPAEVPGSSADLFTARALASLCQAALGGYEIGGGLLLNYNQLPEAAWSRVANHFGVPVSALERERMAQAAQLDSKNPVLPFEPDIEKKNTEATELIRGLADEWIRPHYRQLEALRARTEPA